MPLNGLIFIKNILFDLESSRFDTGECIVNKISSMDCPIMTITHQWELREIGHIGHYSYFYFIILSDSFFDHKYIVWPAWQQLHILKTFIKVIQIVWWFFRKSNNLHSYSFIRFSRTKNCNSNAWLILECTHTGICSHMPMLTHAHSHLQLPARAAICLHYHSICHEGNSILIFCSY